MRLLLNIIFLICLVLLGNHARLDQDNSLENWYGKKHPEIVEWNHIKARFHLEETLALKLEQNALSSNRILETLNFLENLEKIPNCLSLFAVHSALKMNLGQEQTRDMEKSELLSELNFLKSNPLYRSLILDQNGYATLGYLKLSSRINSNARQAILQALDQQGISYTSEKQIETEITTLSQKDTEFLIPILLLLISLTVYLLFRSVRLLFCFYQTVAMTTIPTLAVFFSMGKVFTAISSVLTPLLLILTIVAFTHLAQAWMEKGEPGYKKSMQVVWLSLLTTVLAFLSLNFSELATVRDLGNSVSLGLLCMGLTFQFVLPGTLPSKKDHNLRHLKVNLDFLPGIPKAVFPAILLLSLWSLYSTKTNFDVLELLPKTNLTRVNTTQLREAASIGSKEITLVVPVTLESASLNKVLIVEKRLKQLPEVQRLLSPSSLLRFVHHNITESENLNLSEVQLGEYLIAMRESPFSRILDEFYSSNDIRILLGCDLYTPTQWIEFQSKVETVFSEQGLEVKITGSGSLKCRQDSSLLLMMEESLGLTAAGIFLVVLLWSWSLRIALAALLVNLLPILIAYSFAGLLQFDFNVGSSIVGAILMGISIDDSFHVIRDLKASAYSASSKNLPSYHAVNASSLMLIVGFAPFLFSSFFPVFTFGLLLICGVYVALIADLRLLPYLVSRPLEAAVKDGTEQAER